MNIPDEAVQAASEVICAHDNAQWGDSGSPDMYHDLVNKMLTDALPFLTGVKVKALEWTQENHRHAAYALFGSAYAITEYDGLRDAFDLYHRGFKGESKHYSTLEKAKAAAQADYEARIRSATDLAPSPSAQVFEEIISELKEAERKIFSWSGSAFVANELEGAEDADCKSELYGDLCNLGNVMYWLQTQVRDISSHPVENGRKFKLGDRLTKNKGSSWTGLVVGFYSTELTPIGYAIESETEKGSVQIYPEAALRPLPSSPGESE